MQGFEYLTEITEKTEKRDLWHIAAAVSERKPGTMKKFFIIFAVIGAVLLLLSLVLDPWFGGRLFFILGLAFLGYSVFFILSLGITVFSKKRLQEKRGELGTQRTLRFGRQSFETTHSCGRAVNEYKDIKAIYETRDYIFLLMRQGGAIPVIMRYVGEQQHKVIINLLAVAQGEHRIKRITKKSSVAAAQPEVLEPQKGISLAEDEKPLARLEYTLTRKQALCVIRKNAKLARAYLYYFIIIAVVAAITVVYALSPGKSGFAYIYGALALAFALLSAYGILRYVKFTVKTLCEKTTTVLFESRFVESGEAGEAYFLYSDIYSAKKSDGCYILDIRPMGRLILSALDVATVSQNSEFERIFIEKLGDKLKETDK